MNVLQCAIKWGLYELEWAIAQTRDNVSKEESQAVYRKFATVFSRDPFLLAQMPDQDSIRTMLLNPDAIADAKTLYEIAINLQTKINAEFKNGWSELAEIVTSAVESIIESDTMSPDAAKRMDANIFSNSVFLTMAVLYYAVRDYNLILTGAFPGEIIPKRPD